MVLWLKIINFSLMSFRSGCLSIIRFSSPVKRDRETHSMCCSFMTILLVLGCSILRAFFLAFGSWHKQHIPHILQLGMVTLVINTGCIFNPFFCSFLRPLLCTLLFILHLDQSWHFFYKTSIPQFFQMITEFMPIYA